MGSEVKLSIPSHDYVTPTMKDAAIRWSDQLDERAYARYDWDGNDLTKKRMPPVYASMDEAKAAFTKLGRDYATAGDKPRPQEKMSVSEIAERIVKNAHFTAFDDGGSRALYMYDYDRGIYVEPGKRIDVLIVALARHVTNQIRASVQDTILASTEDLMYYNPLPPHKIAVGNGLYNLITHEFEPFSPVWTTLNKIDTEYHEDAVELDAGIFGDVTFRSMCESFANGNSDRVRLLEEICKAVVIGSTRRPASFFVVGEGGDGKSTFFEKMLGSAIGQSNVAQLSLDDMNADDKLLLCESAKMVLGTDNRNDVYINDDKRFKQLSTHDRITVSRKYLDARSIFIGAVMIQLCNTFPRFHSTNNSITRRIVPVKAENRYVMNGEDDENVSDIVVDKQFSEHVLASILALPYRLDFCDCDMDLLDESAAVNDTLGQFVDACKIEGLLDETTLIIPTSHLYAAYEDWMDDNAPKDKVMASRTFTSRITRYMEKYGFKLDADALLRPGAGTLADSYTTDSFGSMVRGERLRQTIDANRPSKVFVRDKGVDPTSISTRSILKRTDEECSVYAYLGIETQLYRFMTPAEREKHEKELAELEEKYGKKSPTKRGATVFAKPEKMPNVMVAYRMGDHSSLARIRAWLEKVASEKVENDHILKSNLDTVLSQIQRVVPKVGDAQLTTLASNLDLPTSPARQAELALEVIDVLIDDMKSKGGEQ